MNSSSHQPLLSTSNDIMVRPRVPSGRTKLAFSIVGKKKQQSNTADEESAVDLSMVSSNPSSAVLSASSSPPSSPHHSHNNNPLLLNQQKKQRPTTSSSSSVGATLQERILQARVSELEAELKQSKTQNQQLMQSLRTSISSHDATQARLASLTELVAANSAAVSNKKGYGSSSSTTASMRDAMTQAPDMPDASAFDADLERASLYSSKDVRGALMSLLDRHEDVKQLLLRNSWLRRNADYCQKFPSHVTPIRPVAIELVNGRRPPTAEAISNAAVTPRSQLHTELSEMTRRSHPSTRHRK